jgi:hypothetical protein
MLNCTETIFWNNSQQRVKTKQRIRQNKITVLFRAYIDCLKISDYKDASECKSQVINLLQYGQLGSLTLKHLVKIIFNVFAQ